MPGRGRFGAIGRFVALTTMLTVAGATRVLVATTPVDLRGSFNRLYGLVIDHLIYTLLGSCRRHGINPFEYLKDLFTRLPAAKIAEIKAFTPGGWAKRKAKMARIAPAA